MSNAPKDTKAIDKADLANSALVAQALEVSGKATDLEFPLLEKFAKVMVAGKLSVRGAKATIEEIVTKGGSLPSLKQAHAQDLVTAWELSKIEGAPKVIGQLCAKAEHLRRSASDADKASLEVKTNSEVALAKAQGAQDLKLNKSDKAKSVWEKFAKANPAPAKSSRQAHHNGKAKTISVSPADLGEVASALSLFAESNAEITPAMAEALMELSAVIETILDSQA